MARIDLCNEFKKICMTNIGNSKKQKKIAEELLSENGIPMSITGDLLSLRKLPESSSEIILYHILRKLDSKVLPKYFTEQVSKQCDKWKYKDEKAEILPLKFNVIKINDNQWVGKITAKKLVELGNAGLINYNANAQRIFKHVIIGGEEYYKININRKAVDSIKKSFKDSHYIPNIITLNIPYTDDSVFKYSEKTNEMIISKIVAFDILDGYHRYVAIQNIIAEDSNFDYEMELRLTFFSDDIARQFIWQEDQKTKMSKVDSRSFNKYDASNIIVKKICEGSYGSIISSNDGIISFSVLSHAISVIYNIKPDKNYKLSEIGQISNKIVNGFDEIQKSNPVVFDTKQTELMTYCFVACIKKNIFDYSTIKKLYKSSLKYFNENRKLKNTEINKIVKELEGM